VLTKRWKWREVRQEAKSSCSKKEVDEAKEVPHNLVSLLLTNKTICGDGGGRRCGRQVVEMRR